MKHKKFLGLLLIVSGMANAGPAPQMPPASVAVALVEQAVITPTLPVSGTVYSRNDLQITSSVDGQLEFVAEPGTMLAEGDVIASIDTFQLELQQAEQQAQHERAKAQLKFLDAQLKRQRNLAQQNTLAANELEQTQSQRDVAASDLRIAELRLRQIEDNLRRATIRAKFSGVVVQRLRREGEDVARGTPLARVTDLENLEVRVYAPLRFSGRVKPGDTLNIFGFQSEHLGRVRSVVPSVDQRSQSFEIRIDLTAEAREQWAVGQLVSVAVPIQAGRESLAVPRDALILRRDGTYVFRINDEYVAERVKVATGDGSGDLIAVDGNLQEGDKVVIRGAETLSDGRQVTIIDQDDASSGAYAAGG
ncbi:MAG: efflux RND transporter periplasmic adaptor subunit [Gammaproteobacteria bacterium]